MIKVYLRRYIKRFKRLKCKFERLGWGQVKNLKKKLALAACSVVIAVAGIGMASIPHEESPVSEELLEEAMAQQLAQLDESETEDDYRKICEEGCTLEEGHDGPCVVKKEDVKVVLKSTSVERDLKVKFVDEATGKVITGVNFKMKLTDSSEKATEYSDKDADGIIWVKDIEGGSYLVAMVEMDGYVAAKTLSAEVKKKIEYKVVEVAEEVKKESEIVVSQEDAEFSGTDKDESTSDSKVLQDTVEYVASKKEEKSVTTDQQKVDSFGQKVYEKQKTDELGQPMYAKIKSESSNFHKDEGKDGICDRCGASLGTSCTEHVDADENCVCDKCKEELPHKDEDKNCECDICKNKLAHTDSDGDGVCDNANCWERPSQETDTDPEEPGQNLEEQSQPSNELAVRKKQAILGLSIRPVYFLRAAAEKQFIEYDTSSAPIYDTSSNPVYETKTTTVYYGWQTIDGATYYFDKNGSKVTGQQVIQGVAYTFSSDGVRSGTIGIDVSKYQTNINWTKIKNAGINFVMIRCGYRGYGSGVLVEDPMYASHIKGAKAAGLRVGVYFFSQAVNEAEAVEEASMAVSLAKKYGINMPIAIDSEYANGGKGRADGLSKSARTTVTKAFCNTVKNAGYTPMVYASKSWFSSHLDVSQLSSYKIWVAHYADKCGYTGRYDIWQNTDKGKVDGYAGYLDMNISSI